MAVPSSTSLHSWAIPAKGTRPRPIYVSLCRTDSRKRDVSADSNFANMNVDGNATISTAEHVSQNDPADLSESNSNVNVFLKAFVKTFVKTFVKAFIASSRQNMC